MNIQVWLQKTCKQLAGAGITTARLECLVLLEDILGKDRTHLLAHPETKLTSEQEKLLHEQIARRINHEPLAYIRGKSEFYGREFQVSQYTLEPRPETETLVNLAKKNIKVSGVRTLADIGTGSGCIAVSLKLELPHIEMYATDVDEECIKITQDNATKLQADIVVMQGDLLKPLQRTKVDMLLCNLPYVPAKYELNKAATFEPKHAIFGGDDGLDLYRKLFAQIEIRGQKPEMILTESLPFQHEALAATAQSSGYKLIETDDFIQRFHRLS